MIGWHHRLNGDEFEQAPGNGESQGDLAFCSPWGSQIVGHNCATEQQMTASGSQPQGIFLVTDISQKMKVFLGFRQCVGPWSLNKTKVVGSLVTYEQNVPQLSPCVQSTHQKHRVCLIWLIPQQAWLKQNSWLQRNHLCVYTYFILWRE